MFRSHVWNHCAIACALITFAFGTTALAAPVNWLSNADGDWATPANWSSNPALPGVVDDVTISRPAANPIITHSSGTDSINSLICNETLAITGGSLSMANASQFNAGTTLTATLTGAGNFALAGPFTWTAGTMSGAGTSTLTGTLSLAGDVTLGRTLTNSNIINWSNGHLFFTNGTLNNNVTLNATAQNRSLLNNGGTNLFTNSGTFNVNPGADFSLGIQIPFTHSGTMNVQSGTLFISQPGTVSGPVDISPNAVLELSSNTSFNAGTAFTNTGPLRFINGVHTFNTPIGFGNRTVTIQNATLTGSDALTITAPFMANSGTIISGTGALNLNAGSVFNVGTGDIVLARLTHNNVLIDWTAGNIFMTNGTINNNTILNARSPNRAMIDNGGTNALNNPGTIMVDPGLGSFTEIRVPFTNTGTVNILSGTLFITQVSAHSSLIDIPANTFLDFFQSSTINAGTVFGGTGAIDYFGGTHTFNIPMNFGSHDVTISNSTLTGTGDLTFNTYLDWLSGTVSGTGQFTAAAACNLGIANDVVLSRTLTQDGTCNQFGGNLFMTTTTINNNGVYTCYSQGGGLIENGGVNAFNNVGTFNADAGDGFFAEMRVPFTNTGIVNVVSGSLAITRGGSSNGIFNVPSDTSLQFYGANFTHNAGITFNGTGLIGFLGATHTFPAPIDFAGHPVSLANATLTGAGNRTFGNEFVWGGGGTISGPGQTIVAPTSHLRITGGDRVLASLITANGTCDWTGGHIFATDGTFTNTGTMLASVGGRGYIENGGTNAFNNTGTLNRNGPGTFEVRAPFANSGTVNVQAGDLGITRPYTQTAGTLRLSGGNVFGGSTLTILAGTLEGAGQIIGNVSNAGLTQPGLSAGTLAIVGTFSQSVGSSTNVELAGTPTTQYDRIIVSGAATVNGSLNVALINAFVPSANNAFYLVTGSSVVGTHNAVTLPPLPGRLRWELVYHPTTVELRVILPGDTNCNGIMTIADLPSFVQTLLDPAGYLNANPACDVDRADMNNDGNADGLDIQLWIDTLLTGG